MTRTITDGGREWEVIREELPATHFRPGRDRLEGKNFRLVFRSGNEEHAIGLHERMDRQLDDFTDEELVKILGRAQES